MPLHEDPPGSGSPLPSRPSGEELPAAPPFAGGAEPAPLAGETKGVGDG
jgi:hypothetical protein